MKRMDLQEYRVELEGELDMEGFLKADGSIRPGLQAIRVRTYVKSAHPPEEVKALLAEVEKRCPVGDSILHGVPIEMSHEIVSP